MKKLLVLAVVMLIALWGCAQQPEAAPEPMPVPEPAPEPAPAPEPEPEPFAPVGKIEVAEPSAAVGKTINAISFEDGMGIGQFGERTEEGDFVFNVMVGDVFRLSVFHGEPAITLTGDIAETTVGAGERIYAQVTEAGDLTITVSADGVQTDTISIAVAEASE